MFALTLTFNSDGQSSGVKTDEACGQGVVEVLAGYAPRARRLKVSSELSVQTECFPLSVFFPFEGMQEHRKSDSLLQPRGLSKNRKWQTVGASVQRALPCSVGLIPDYPRVSVDLCGAVIESSKGRLSKTPHPRRLGKPPEILREMTLRFRG